MFCKNCGAKINKKDSECKNCGYKNIELTYVDKYNFTTFGNSPR